MNQLIRDVLGLKSKQSINNKELFMLPVKDIKDLIITNDNKYKFIAKVSPVNGDLMSDSDLDAICESIAAALNSFNGRVGIYIQSERVDIESNLMNIEKHKAELKNEFKLNLLNLQKKHLELLANKSRNVLNFYIVLEVKANNYVSAEQLLYDSFSSVKNELESGNMYCYQLREHDIKSLLYERLNPEKSSAEPYCEEWELADILPDNAKIYKDGRHIEVENKIYRFFSIRNYPKRVNKFRWLRRLFKIKGDINIAIILTPKDNSKIQEQLSKAYKELGGKAKSSSDKHIQKKYEDEQKSAEDMLEKIGSENLNLYDVNVTIGISENSIEKLNTFANIVRSAISASKCTSAEIKYKEFDPLFTTLPILAENKITNNYVWNLTSEDVASIIPFDSSEYMESKGTLIGENDTSGGLVIVDYYNRNYNNSHLSVIADSGSGKTFFLMCDSTRNIPYVDYTIMFDNKGDLIFPWGSRYIFSATSGLKTNPFHIRNAIIDSNNMVDNGNADVGTFLSQKIMDLIVFFRWIIKDMDSSMEAILEEDIRDAYKSKGLDFDSKVLPSEFPTLSTLGEIVDYKIKNSDDEEETKIRKKIRTSLKPYISGAYASMFNGQTNWDFEFFTVFVLSNLPDAVKLPMYDLLLKDVWQFCKKDGTKNPLRKRVYVDEAHLFADEKNPQTLEFLSTKLSKMGRGFGVSLITATQNLPDFLAIPKHGQAIIDNSYFKFFMRLGENDLPVAEKLFRFSDSEIKVVQANNAINKSTKGKGIFIIGSQRVVVQVRASKDELEIIDPIGYENIYGVPSRYFTKDAEVV